MATRLGVAAPAELEWAAVHRGPRILCQLLPVVALQPPRHPTTERPKFDGRYPAAGEVGTGGSALCCCRESVDQGTTGRLACVATAHSMNKGTLHRAEIGNLRPNIHQMANGEFAHFDTGFPSSVG
jgi:hypothetical protein